MVIMVEAGPQLDRESGSWSDLRPDAEEFVPEFRFNPEAEEYYPAEGLCYGQHAKLYAEGVVICADHGARVYCIYDPQRRRHFPLENGSDLEQRVRNYLNPSIKKKDYYYVPDECHLQHCRLFTSEFAICTNPKRATKWDYCNLFYPKKGEHVPIRRHALGRLDEMVSGDCFDQSEDGQTGAENHINSSPTNASSSAGECQRNLVRDPVMTASNTPHVFQSSTYGATLQGTANLQAMPVNPATDGQNYPTHYVTAANGHYQPVHHDFQPASGPFYYVNAVSTANVTSSMPQVFQPLEILPRTNNFNIAKTYQSTATQTCPIKNLSSTVRNNRKVLHPASRRTWQKTNGYFKPNNPQVSRSFFDSTGPTYQLFNPVPTAKNVSVPHVGQQVNVKPSQRRKPVSSSNDSRAQRTGLHTAIKRRNNAPPAENTPHKRRTLQSADEKTCQMDNEVVAAGNVPHVPQGCQESVTSTSNAPTKPQVGQSSSSQSCQRTDTYASAVKRPGSSQNDLILPREKSCNVSAPVQNPKSVRTLPATRGVGLQTDGVGPAAVRAKNFNRPPRHWEKVNHRKPALSDYLQYGRHSSAVEFGERCHSPSWNFVGRRNGGTLSHLHYRNRKQFQRNSKYFRSGSH